MITKNKMYVVTLPKHKREKTLADYCLHLMSPVVTTALRLENQNKIARKGLRRRAFKVTLHKTIRNDDFSAQLRCVKNWCPIPWTRRRFSVKFLRTKFLNRFHKRASPNQEFQRLSCFVVTNVSSFFPTSQRLLRTLFPSLCCVNNRPV